MSNDLLRESRWKLIPGPAVQRPERLGAVLVVELLQEEGHPRPADLVADHADPIGVQGPGPVLPSLGTNNYPIESGNMESEIDRPEHGLDDSNLGALYLKQVGHPLVHFALAFHRDGAGEEGGESPGVSMAEHGGHPLGTLGPQHEIGHHALQRGSFSLGLDQPLELSQERGRGIVRGEGSQDRGEPAGVELHGLSLRLGRSRKGCVVRLGPLHCLPKGPTLLGGVLAETPREHGGQSLVGVRERGEAAVLEYGGAKQLPLLVLGGTKAVVAAESFAGEVVHRGLLRGHRIGGLGILLGGTGTEQLAHGRSPWGASWRLGTFQWLSVDDNGSRFPITNFSGNPA